MRFKIKLCNSICYVASNGAGQDRYQVFLSGDYMNITDKLTATERAKVERVIERMTV